MTDFAHWMITPDGQVLQPNEPGARWAGKALGARPIDPERFPWRCVATVYATIEHSDRHDEHVQMRCVLVEGHSGEHEGMVKWS